MIALIIIAGPQSCGKTTVFNILKKKLNLTQKTLFLPEVNPFTIRGKNHLGGAFTDHSLEKMIIEEDLKILKKAKNQKPKIIISETGIFHLVYGERLLKKTELKNFYKKYLKLYRNFNTKIIFIDTKPKVSWRRRRLSYIMRIEKAGIKNRKEKIIILKKYKKTIEDLYPIWKKWYKTLPYEKYLIKNSSKSLEEFTTQMLILIDKLLTL